MPDLENTNYIMMKLELTYFKTSGKYYTTGQLDTLFHQFNTLITIWEYVIKLRDIRKLPGLVEGSGGDFIILVDVPNHPHNHPKLILPDSFGKYYTK